MNIAKSLKATWLVGGALVASAGCLPEDDVHQVTAMYAMTDSGARYAVRGVAVDRPTYDQMVEALGAEPTEVNLTPDAPAGTVQVMFAPSSPLTAAYLAAPEDGPTPEPPSSIGFDDGSTQVLIGLLLPAVQKVREAAARGSNTTVPAGTLDITLEGSGTASGGVYVAAGDLNGDGFDAAEVFAVGTYAPGTPPEQRTAMADAFVSPTGLDRARLDSNDGSFVLGELAIPDPYLMGRWASADTTMNLVVDVRESGKILTRFRVPRAHASTTAKSAAHVRVIDGTKLTRDGDAERAMFNGGYATFTSDAIDKAARTLLDYANADTMSMAIASWNAGRTQAIADIIAATGAGGPPHYEAMACAAGLPTAVAVANGLDLNDAANASAVATVYEATALDPQVGLVSGGQLALQKFGATAPTGDAELACAAVHQLASLPDTLDSAGGKAIRGLAVELAAFDARYLEIELTHWIEDMDALVLTPDQTAWAAAKTKADILIESLGNAKTRTEARMAMAKSLLGL